MPIGESFHVHFVNYALVPRDPRRPISPPGKRGINHNAFKHARSAVAPVKRQIFISMTDSVSEMRIAPFKSPEICFA